MRHPTPLDSVPSVSLASAKDQTGKFKQKNLLIACRNCGTKTFSQSMSYFDRFEGKNYHADILKPIMWDAIYISNTRSMHIIPFCEDCKPSDLYNDV